VIRHTEIIYADSWFSRLKGLLGTQREEWLDRELVLSPCKAIHTIGMKYALDIAFVSRDQVILALHKTVAPNRIIRGPRKSYGVIERPSQDRPWYQIGSAYKKESL